MNYHARVSNDSKAIQRRFLGENKVNIDDGGFLIVTHELLSHIGRMGNVQFTVYLMLLKHLNIKTGECYPSQETLAQELNIDARSVRRHIKSLKDNGYIIVVEDKYIKKNKDNMISKDSNYYIFVPLSEVSKPVSQDAVVKTEELREEIKREEAPVFKTFESLFGKKKAENVAEKKIEAASEKKTELASAEIMTDKNLNNEFGIGLDGTNAFGDTLKSIKGRKMDAKRKADYIAKLRIAEEASKIPTKNFDIFARKAQ